MRPLACIDSSNALAAPKMTSETGEMAHQKQDKIAPVEQVNLAAAYAPLLSKMLVYLTIVICFIELLGWGMNSVVFSQLRTGLAAMVPSTAIFVGAQFGHCAVHSE